MGLAPYGRPNAVKPLLKMKSDKVEIPEWGVEFDKPFLPEHERDWEASPSMQHWKDIAWRVQDDAETLLLKCVANGRIVREAGFDNVWIQPAAGDDGIAIGCAYYGYLAILKKQRPFVMTHASLPAQYSAAPARAAAPKSLVRLQT